MFLFEENHEVLLFEKVRFEMRSVHTKTQSRRFQILRFLERFRKVPFSWRITLNRKPSRRNKAVCVFLLKELSRGILGYFEHRQNYS